jgi:hypothetical protein
MQSRLMPVSHNCGCILKSIFWITVDLASKRALLHERKKNSYKQGSTGCIQVLSHTAELASAGAKRAAIHLPPRVDLAWTRS